MNQSETSDKQTEHVKRAYQHDNIVGSKDTRHPTAVKVAYLLKTYPRLSETFILNEILGLEELGAQLHILSLRRPDDNSFHPAVEDVAAEVTYSLELTGMKSILNWIVLVKLHLLLVLRRPTSYIRTVSGYLRQPGRRRLKEVIHAGYFAHILRESGCSHIHAHFANAPTTVAELIHGFTNLPYSFTAHAKDIYHSTPNELDRKIKNATFVLTCTDYNRRYLTALSTSSTEISCVYHGIDLGLFDGHKLPAKTDTVGTIPLILSIGRFCEKKGFTYLIRACRILKEHGLEYRCVIVGYGPMLEELKMLIVQLSLEDRVSLVGKMTHDRVVEMYRNADIFTLPCLITDDGDRDGIPNVLIEAMAQRLPVVSTDVSGISELVETMKNGLLVKEKNSEELAEALELLLHEPMLRKQMGDRGREQVIRNFSFSTSASGVWSRFQTNGLTLSSLQRITGND